MVLGMCMCQHHLPGARAAGENHHDAAVRVPRPPLPGRKGLEDRDVLQGQLVRHAGPDEPAVREMLRGAASRLWYLRLTHLNGIARAIPSSKFCNCDIKHEDGTMLDAGLSDCSPAPLGLDAHTAARLPCLVRGYS